jgi:hypothetical protein
MTPRDESRNYDSFAAPQLTQRQPAPERQEIEQPTDEHSLDESRRRRVVRKAGDAGSAIAGAALEILVGLLS